MCTPPPGWRHYSPPPQLVDDLIREILLRLPPDDPACLERASLACKTWRRILTDPGFLRRYRAFHRTPPMLGFLSNTFGGGGGGCGVPYSYTARFVPTVSFRPAAPDRRGMFAIAARHGRVLLAKPGPLECFVVWDPITDEQWAVPPLPAAPLSATRFNATVFCAAAGCDHLDCHGGPFAVAFVGNGRPFAGTLAGTLRTLACVYLSEAGEWGEPAKLVGRLPISNRPGVLVGNVVYFTCSPVLMSSIVEYDMARGKLSVFVVPSLHKNHGCFYPTTALTVTEDGRLGFAGMFHSELFLWSWESGPTGAMAWKHRRNIKLDTMRSSRDGMDAAPGGDPQHKGPMWHVPCVIGFADSAGIVFVGTEAGAVFSVELKSGHARETSLPGFPCYDPLLMPYLSFYSPVAGPSMKSLQIEEVAISDGEFLGDNNKQVDDVNMPVHHSGDADKQRLMGESVEEQRQVWDAIDEQQKLKNQEERRQKQENKKRKLELEVRRKGLEERRKSAKIWESEMIRAEGGCSRSARKLSQRGTKSLLGRLPLVRSPGVNMLRSPLGVLASVAASKRGRSLSVRDEYPPLGKRAKSSARSQCMSRSQSPTTSPLGGSRTSNSRD